MPCTIHPLSGKRLQIKASLRLRGLVVEVQMYLLELQGFFLLVVQPCGLSFAAGCRK